MGYQIQVRFAVFANRSGALDLFWHRYESSPFMSEGLTSNRIHLTANAEVAAVWSNWIREQSPPPAELEMLLILTDSEAIQRLAVISKLKRKMPTIVMRWWDSPANLQKSYRNRLVFNRYTGINFVISRDILHANNVVPSGGLTLDNSILLDQHELLGSDSELKVMRHTLDALTQPNRTDVFGRHKRNHGHLRLAVATHFYCNQDNINAVTALLEHYARYPAAVLERVQFVVVDDGSPIEYSVPRLDLNLIWVKVDQNIRWNQSGARNLALLFARSNNVIISDVDHLFPEHTLRWLIGRNVEHNRFYKFHRKMPDGSMTRGHPNIFYLSRSRWFQLFGTDEEFSGAYGAEDFRFVKNFKNHGTVQMHLPKRFYCEERQVDRKKSYHSLIRDLSFNTGVDTRKRMEADYFGAEFSHSRSVLNFTWTVLADYERCTQTTPSLDRGWRPRWLFRQLLSLVCSC